MATVAATTPFVLIGGRWLAARRAKEMISNGDSASVLCDDGSHTIREALFPGSPQIHFMSGRWDSNPRPPEPHQSGRKPRRRRRLRICEPQPLAKTQAKELVNARTSPESSAAQFAGMRARRHAALLWCAGCRLPRVSGSRLSLELCFAGRNPSCPLLEDSAHSLLLPLQNMAGLTNRLSLRA